MAGTIADAFTALKLEQWWTEPHNDYFGQNGEKGQDYGMSGGFGTPVGCLVPGKVVYVGDGGYPGSSIGWIVQISPPGGGVFHYQHLQSASVKLGQMVQTGTVVGKSGGCPAGAYGATGQCTRLDQYSTGNHIEVRFSPTYDPTSVWNQAWTNPLQLFAALANGPAAQVASGGLNFTNLTNPVNTLAPNADVANVLIAIDNLGALVNPFDVRNAQTDSFLFFSWTDPLSWLGGVGTNMFTDTRALAFRLMLLLIGAVVMYKVFTKFVDVGPIVQAATNIGKSVALAGA